MNNEEDLKKLYTTARLLHLAFIPTLGLYLLISELLPGQIMSSSFTELRYVFYGIAVLLVILLQRMRQRIPKRAKLLTSSIVISACCEIPGLLGLIYVLLTGQKKDFYFLLLISFVLFLINIPRYSTWEQSSTTD